ncbi:MAG: hypothetical protein ACI9NQ_000878, partial [Paracoccaceae bacterium]
AKIPSHLHQKLFIGGAEDACGEAKKHIESGY